MTSKFKSWTIKRNNLLNLVTFFLKWIFKLGLIFLKYIIISPTICIQNNTINHIK